MIQQPNIQSLLADDELIKKLLDIRVEEEAGRLDGIPGVMPKEFTLFDDATKDDAVKKAYTVMQAQYVLRTEDRIEYDDAMAALNEIHRGLINCKAWTRYEPTEELLKYIQQKIAERSNAAPIRDEIFTQTDHAHRRESGGREEMER